MRRIAGLEHQIRESVNDRGLLDRHFRARRDDWHAICAAMDTLGDTALALLDFEARGLGSDHGERYLRLYGFLQAVFLQQDSIVLLADVLVGERFKSADQSDWVNIRELRNLTAGHPLANTSNKPGTTKRVAISRIGLSDQSLVLLWNKTDERSSPLHVDLQAIYAYVSPANFRFFRAFLPGW